ncbi:MAG: hypothetical protein ABSH00_02425 [Bryobacteraceae bacterium]
MAPVAGQIVKEILNPTVPFGDDRHSSARRTTEQENQNARLLELRREMLDMDRGPAAKIVRDEAEDRLAGPRQPEYLDPPPPAPGPARQSSVNPIVTVGVH